MEYTKTLVVNEKLAGKIRTYTDTEPSCKEECLGEEGTLVFTARFEDGSQMDIKCCGVQFQEGECNSAWTEAVLFDRDGREVCFSEPSDSFFGMWQLETEDNTYTVFVKTEAENRRDTFEEKCYNAYQLYWMLSHGYSLQDAYEIIVGIASEEITHPMNIPTDETGMSVLAKEAKNTFLNDVGFGPGSMFACKEEFLSAEYLDEDYMRHLFSLMREKNNMEIWSELTA